MLRRHLGKITIITVLFATFGSGLLLVALWSVDDALNYTPTLSVEAAELPDLSATSFMVLDAESGTEIVSKNSTEVYPIASITKLFTAAALYSETGFSGETVITYGDVANEGRAGKLAAGQTYPYHELVHAMLLESSNDAAAALLRAEPELLENMNAMVTNEGFSETQFADTSGLSDRNVSTSYELASLIRQLYLDQPHLFDITRQEELIGTYTGWVNNDPLHALSGFRGGKHGFTNEAGKTAAVVMQEPVGNTEREFVIVLLGSEDLVADTEQLEQFIRKQVDYR